MNTQSNLQEKKVEDNEKYLTYPSRLVPKNKMPKINEFPADVPLDTQLFLLLSGDNRNIDKNREIFDFLKTNLSLLDSGIRVRDLDDESQDQLRKKLPPSSLSTWLPGLGFFSFSLMFGCSIGVLDILKNSFSIDLNEESLIVKNKATDQTVSLCALLLEHTVIEQQAIPRDYLFDVIHFLNDRGYDFAQKNTHNFLTLYGLIKDTFTAPDDTIHAIAQTIGSLVEKKTLESTVAVQPNFSGIKTEKHKI